MKDIIYSRKVTFVTYPLCLLAFLSSLTMPVSAEVYRWVDSEGKTHYGDRAPQEPRAKAERVEIKSGPAGIDPDAERARQQMRSINEGRQREQAFADQRAAEDQQKQAELTRRCRALQDEIRADRDTAIFYRYDDKGNRVLWTNEERLAYREKLQTINQTNCPALSE